MVIVHNPRYRLIALAVSLAFFAIIYFAVIAPANNTADTQARQGEQQVNNAVKKAAKENPGSIPAGVQNLTACIAAAGTNSGELQACAAKFKK